MACWDDAMFVDTLRSDHPARCAICQDIMCDAIQCPNQHCFGKECLERALQYNPECPTCREPCPPEKLKPALFARSAIARMNVRCPRRDEGCPDEFQLADREAHEMNCGYVKVSCPHSGCKRSVLRKDLNTHALNCEHATDQCHVCDEVMPRSKVAAHSCFRSVVTRMGALEARLTALELRLESNIQVQSDKTAPQTADLPPQQQREGHTSSEDSSSVRSLGPRRATAWQRPESSRGLQRSISGSQPSPAVAQVARPASVTSTIDLAAATGAMAPLSNTRPSEFDIVIAAPGVYNGCLADGTCGYIMRDEHDHQPFSVSNLLGQFWYRESEVCAKTLALPWCDTSIVIFTVAPAGDYTLVGTTVDAPR
ncbi:uncharacterized protein MONBRDRAFT_8463 [Monosiga brevicollis MX1]|uniref:TRAF-type domain-containing protein n=1 Tax=Monosiga brevicollis TaxID=81824 RepID=A9V041_MONBE|nr:uncharacterized protein MONBRDRAFT_8463 [Monosiga brevicollis MX1]EDQ89092.1 predicted protein [Monosiga brevicollis MX1]|eukprot:XP_001746197.1 hypothetical protein [Monosiga brevicollis MX1]